MTGSAVEKDSAAMQNDFSDCGHKCVPYGDGAIYQRRDTVGTVTIGDRRYE